MGAGAEGARKDREAGMGQEGKGRARLLPYALRRQSNRATNTQQAVIALAVIALAVASAGSLSMCSRGLATLLSPIIYTTSWDARALAVWCHLAVLSCSGRRLLAVR